MEKKLSITISSRSFMFVLTAESTALISLSQQNKRHWVMQMPGKFSSVPWWALIKCLMTCQS